MDGSKILIFVETKRGADTLTREMRTNGWPALSIHGDKQQSERDWVLKEFRDGKNPILIATDVAARGLDVKNVKFVINYDMPGQIEDYIHRIGRTGRAGTQGSAYSFFTSDKSRVAADLVKVLKEANQNVPDELMKFASQSKITVVVVDVDEDGRKKDRHMSAKLPSDCFDHTSRATFVFIDVFPMSHFLAQRKISFPMMKLRREKK